MGLRRASRHLEDDLGILAAAHHPGDAAADHIADVILLCHGRRGREAGKQGAQNHRLADHALLLSGLGGQAAFPWIWAHGAGQTNTLSG